jgi:hypothetical protein
LAVEAALDRFCRLCRLFARITSPGCSHPVSPRGVA